jgi:glycine/D-amino acid oxidase-like deaminating enzyme
MNRAEPEREAYYREQSFWLSSVPGSLVPEAPLQGEQQAGVVIIGAGYTGLWAAHYLKQHDPQLDIAIIEAHTAGYGASGRNGGWAIGSCAGLEGWLENPATRSEARKLAAALQASVADIGKACTELDIDCHFEQSGYVAAAVLPVQLQRFREAWQFEQDIGLGEERLAWLDAPALQDLAHIHGALGGLYTPHCAAIHPARLVRGLAASLKQGGVRFYEQSPVTRLDGRRVVTANGAISGETVLLATEGYTGTINGLAAKLIPVHSMMVATEPLSDEQLAATGLKRRINFCNGNHVATYGQLTADRRLAFGCRGGYVYGGKPVSDFSPANPEFRKVEQELLRFFPALEGVGFSHAWGGSMGVSRRLRPAIGFDSGQRLGWAGGYFGEGVNASHLAGRTLADLALGRDTERSRALWVNNGKEADLYKARWEPEPLRWMGVASGRSLMGITDSAERRDSALAPALLRTMQFLFP